MTKSDIPTPWAPEDGEIWRNLSNGREYVHWQGRWVPMDQAVLATDPELRLLAQRIRDRLPSDDS